MTCLTSLVTKLPSYCSRTRNACVLSAPVTTLLFQQDINHLYDWTDHWGLSLNVGKCESSRFFRKRNNLVPSLAEKPYTLGGHALAVVSFQKDLGITVTNKLSCSPRISIIVAKANRMLGFLCRHCSTYVGTNQRKLLYLTFVRSHFGYASELLAYNPVSDLKLPEGI